MYRYLFSCIIAFLLLHFNGQAQESAIIKLKVSDTLIFSPLQDIEISYIVEDAIVLRKDAVLEQDVFLEINQSGRLQIFHHFFEGIEREITLGKDTVDLGVLYLEPKMNFLDEVEIAYRPAIDQRGDTLLFTADSFMNNEYDDLIELFKNIPGIEIDMDGGILVHGQQLTHLLVDGEPFFGENPEETARLLRSAMVDRIEVYDQKSEIDEFMDTDSGERFKTINIRLKDSAKKGIVGKANVGGAIPDYWNNNLNLNAFEDKRKISVFGNMNNTANTDRSSGSSRRGRGGGGSGKPKTWATGAHYSNKWLDDSLSLNGSFRYTKDINENERFSETQYILPDTQYLQIQQSETKNIRHGLSANQRLEFKPNATSAFQLDIRGNYGTGKSSTQRSSRTEDLEGKLINQNTVDQQSESENKSLNFRLSYRKKMKKKGRGISSSLSVQWSESESNSLLKSDYDLFAIDSAYQIWQKKTNFSGRNAIQWQNVFTEPLHDKVNVELNYSAGLNNSQNDHRSYDQEENQQSEYELFNPLNSSRYAYRRFENRGGFRIVLSEERLNISIGSNVAHSHYLQKDLFQNADLSYHRFNLFPTAHIRWRKNNSVNLFFNYNGNTRQPDIEQLEPLRNNEDPMNIAIGNPDLKQEFQHNFNAYYNSFDSEKENTLNLYAQFSFIQDAISLRQEIDESGRRTYQYVNVSGNYNVSAHVNYSHKIQDRFRANLRISGAYGRSNNFINGLANENQNFRFSPNIGLQYLNQEIGDVQFNFSPIYIQNVSSVRKEVRPDYWSFQQSLQGNINLPSNFRVGTSFDWQIRERLSADDGRMNTIYWNAYVERALLKDKSLTVQLFMHDILNQNNAYSRQLSSEQISEQNGDVIKRYFMLSVLWNFNW